MTNYEQLLALSTSLDPAAREYVVALLGEHREMREALQGCVAAIGLLEGTPIAYSLAMTLSSRALAARAILAKVQAP